MAEPKLPDLHKGWLYKWTNYLRGYQKRWFVIDNGYLSYYRNQAEMAHTCRGTINLVKADIWNYDACTFVIRNQSTQTFHLKANSEVERQRWVTALELSKTKAVQLQEAADNLNEDSDDPDNSSVEPRLNKRSINNLGDDGDHLLQRLRSKLDDLKTCDELLAKRGDSLLDNLREVESILGAAEGGAQIRQLHERVTMFKITTGAMLSASKEFETLASSQHHAWERIFAKHRDSKSKLEDMLEQLAKQLSALEKKAAIRQKQVGAADGAKLAVRQQSHAKIASSKSRSAAAAVVVVSGDTSAAASGGGGGGAASIATVVSGVGAKDVVSTRTTTSSDRDNQLSASDILSDEDDEFFEALEHPDDDSFRVTLPRQLAVSHSLLDANAILPNHPDEYESDVDEDDEDCEQRSDPSICATTLQVVTKRERKNVGPRGVFVAGGGSSTSLENSLVPPSNHVNRNSFTSSRVSGGNHFDSLTSGHSRTCSDSVQAISRYSNSSSNNKRARRKTIPQKPNYNVNLWGIMKNCIGKELSKIPMPVNFSEPLSFLQRLTEDMEYAECLHKAAQCTDQWEQMAFVAAFTASSYSTTTVRTGKPFNPLLGETYECDRMEDLGWRSIAEQVSHHPPAAALHCESSEWTCWQEFSMTSKFRGKYLQIVPLGVAHLRFHRTGHHYTWRKVVSTVHNIIVGRLWIDNHGEMDIVNHTTGDNCHLNYRPYSYFSREPQRKVTGVITDCNGDMKCVVNGHWDERLSAAKVLNVAKKKSDGTPVIETAASKVLWKRREPPVGSERMYYFTQLAIELNEMEENVSPTDSRWRPDQRLMEDGQWDEANKEKLRLEEYQRVVRRRREIQNEAAIRDGKSPEVYQPAWFRLEEDKVNGGKVHVFNGRYWDCKSKSDWSVCQDIYGNVTKNARLSVVNHNVTNITNSPSSEPVGAAAATVLS